MAFQLDIDLLYRSLTVILILIVTYILGRLISRFFKETFKKAGIPEVESAIVASVLKYSIYLIGITIALGYVDIPTVPLWIALTLGVAILGLAARSALDNLVSGYFLRTYGPFEVGDIVEIEGETARIKDLTPLKTILENPELVTYSIPNAQILRSEIYNYSRYRGGCPVELEFEVPNETDLENLRKEILDIIARYPKVSLEKPVRIYVKRFTEKGAMLRILFFVPNLEVKLGAKDYVASKILQKSKAGKIAMSQAKDSTSPSLAYEPENAEPETPRERPRKDETEAGESIQGPKCPTCDSVSWHGFLHCRTCGSYFIFGKCKECDHLRLEQCPVDEGELEFIAPAEAHK